jgi:hypothetical protein
LSKKTPHHETPNTYEEEGEELPPKRNSSIK